MYKVLEFVVEGKIEGTTGFFNRKKGCAVLFNEYRPGIIKEEDFERYVEIGKEILQERFEKMANEEFIFDEKFGDRRKYKIEKGAKMEIEATIVTYKNAKELTVKKLKEIATVEQYKEIMGCE